MLPVLRKSRSWYFLAFISIIFIGSIWVREAFPVVAIAAPHDDFLFVHLAETILSGHWLGGYNNLTHAKGVAYPIFLALNHLTGLPLKLTEHLVYLCSALYFCSVLGRVYASRWLAAIVFMLLAFVPTPWSPVVGGRVVREGLYVSQVLLIFALAIRCYVEREGASLAEELQKKKRSLILLGLSCGLFWLTREEGVWILPSMAIFVMYWALSRGRDYLLTRAGLLYLLAPLIIALVPVGAVNSLNFLGYGVFRNNDFHSSDFVQAYSALSRIKHAQWQRYVVFPKDAREQAYAFSAAAKELEPFFEGDLGETWRAIGCDQTKTAPCPEILSGWFMWALRDAVQAVGYYESAPKAAAFYRRLASEINQACERSPGACLSTPDTMAPPWRQHYLGDTLVASWRIAATLANLDKMPIMVGQGFGSPAQLATFARVTNETIPSPDICQGAHCNASPGLGKTVRAFRYGLAQTLASAERAVLQVGLPLSMLLLLFWALRTVWRRQLHAELAIGMGLAAAVTVRVLMLGFLDATSIPSDNMLYLSPVVPLALAFVPVMCLGAWHAWRSGSRRPVVAAQTPRHTCLPSSRPAKPSALQRR